MGSGSDKDCPAGSCAWRGQQVRPLEAGGKEVPEERAKAGCVGSRWAAPRTRTLPGGERVWGRTLGMCCVAPTAALSSTPVAKLRLILQGERHAAASEALWLEAGPWGMQLCSSHLAGTLQDAGAQREPRSTSHHQEGEELAHACLRAPRTEAGLSSRARQAVDKSNSPEVTEAISPRGKHESGFLSVVWELERAKSIHSAAASEVLKGDVKAGADRAVGSPQQAEEPLP